MMDIIRLSKMEITIWTVLLLTGIGLLVYFLFFAKPGRMVSVKLDGKVVATYSIDENKHHIIEDGNGGTNELAIENGSARIVNADCPDKLCVNQGTIFKEGQSIICLPHKLVISIEGDENNKQLDAIAGEGN